MTCFTRRLGISMDGIRTANAVEDKSHSGSCQLDNRYRFPFENGSTALSYTRRTWSKPRKDDSACLEPSNTLFSRARSRIQVFPSKCLANSNEPSRFHSNSGLQSFS